MTQKKPREPFFGKNAKPFAIQYVVVILMVILVAPIIKPYIGAVTKPLVQSVLDTFCSIGLCTPEAAQRQRESAPQ